MLKIILLLILISFNTVCVSQKKHTIPSGVYFASRSSEVINPGYYLFNADSTFNFFAVDWNSNLQAIKNNNFLSDTLIFYGEGKWYMLKDSFFILAFNDLSDIDTKISRDKITIQSSSIYPYDSLIITVKATNCYVNTPYAVALLIQYGKKAIFLSSDTTGELRSILPHDYIKGSMSILYGVGQQKKIILPSGNNVHNIKICFEDSLFHNIQLIKPIKESYRLYNKKNKKPINYWNGNNSYFKKVDNGYNILKQIITKSYYKYPIEKPLFDRILKNIEATEDK